MYTVLLCFTSLWLRYRINIGLIYPYPSVFAPWHWGNRIVVVSIILYMGLLPDTLNCGLRMHQECRERFPHHRGLAILIFILKKCFCCQMPLYSLPPYMYSWLSITSSKITLNAKIGRYPPPLPILIQKCLGMYSIKSICFRPFKSA